MKYWLLNDGSAVEMSPDSVLTHPHAHEVESHVYYDFLKNMPPPEPPQRTLRDQAIDKLLAKAVKEKWI